MENSIWAILISVVISYGTTFSTPYITKFFTSTSKSLKEKSKRKKLRFDATVQFVLDNPQEEIILRIRYLQLSIFSFILLVFGIFQLFSNNPAAIIAGLF